MKRYISGLVLFLIIFSFIFMSYSQVFATYAEIEIAKYVILKAAAAAGITFTSMSAANEYYESFIGTPEGRTTYENIKAIESQNKAVFLTTLQSQEIMYNDFLDWSGAKDRTDKIANIAVDIGNNVMDYCRDFADFWLQGMGIKKDFETGNYSYNSMISISVGETYFFPDSSFINTPSRLNINGDVISLIPFFKEGSVTDEGDPYFYFHFYSEADGQDINTSLRNYYRLDGISCNTYKDVIIYDVFYTYKIYIRTPGYWQTKTASKRFASLGRNYLPDNSISFYPDLGVSINNNYIKENIPWENTYSGSQSINVPLGYDNLFNGDDTLPPIWWDDVIGKTPEDIRTENPFIPLDYPLNPDYPYNPAGPGEIPIPTNPDIPVNPELPYVPPYVPPFEIPVEIPEEIPYNPDIPTDIPSDLPFDIPADTTISLDFNPLLNLGISAKFPFCIPFDLRNAVLNLMDNTSKAPKWDVTYRNVSFQINLSEFERLAEITRYFTGLSFTVLLILKTRDLIRG